MASAVEVVFGSIAFAIFCVSVVFSKFPFLPIGRIAGSMLVGGLMVFFRVITMDQAYDAIDAPFLWFHFGIRIVGLYLEQADMFKYLDKMLSYKSRGGKDLLCRICFISAISSANILIEFVLKFASQNNLPPEPFLLALASSANIGSSATPMGNPQNWIIAVQSGISFRKFAAGIVPAMLLGIVVNIVIILCMYWRLLSPVKNEEQAAVLELVAGDEVEERWTRLLLKTCVYLITLGMTWKRWLRKTCVYLVTLGMLIALLMEHNITNTAIATALVLMVVDFKDAFPCLEKVSYPLFLFFCGMFITVYGFNKTGIPSAFWDLMEPHAQIDSPTGIIVLAAVILVLSNVASNVPTVLLLGARVAVSAAAISATQETKAWLVLAWVSTIAGNLSFAWVCSKLDSLQAGQTGHLRLHSLLLASSPIWNSLDTHSHSNRLTSHKGLESNGFSVGCLYTALLNSHTRSYLPVVNIQQAHLQQGQK